MPALSPPSGALPSPTDDADDGIDDFLRAVASAPAQAPPLAPGAVLVGDYELRERLGTGGMATVYRATDRRLGRDVAIKIPKIDGLDERARAQRIRMFEREAQATARLNHPNIVTLHHVGAHEGVPFLVLELLVGETLASRLTRRGTLALPDASQLLDEVLAALAYAHDRGFVHRDLTPRNVFLTTDDRVKVLDFGVAVASASVVGTVTRSAGTPGYMAPEHDRTPDARTDLWAAAVLFLECVTGARPAADRAATVPEALPAPVRAMVSRALAADPARRPTTASEMRAVLAPAATAPPPRTRWSRRAIAIGAVAAIGVAIAAAVTIGGGRGPDTSGPPRLIEPKPGRWQGDPPANSPWEVRLEKLDAHTYRYENYNQSNGTILRGDLKLELLADGTTILSGRAADVLVCPTCVVGYVEFIVLGPSSLYQYKAMWGPTHDNYTNTFPPYRYKWLGATGTVVR